MNNFDLKISKIVGVRQGLNWPQTHTFAPEGQKKHSHGSLLAGLCFKAKQEEIDVASFGTEIISRFQEIYYSSEEKSVFEKLKISLKLLIDEFESQVELEISAGVVILLKDQLVFYFGTTKQARAFILRNNQLGEIIKDEEKKVNISSGFLKENDLIVLGTSQFFEIVPLGTLKAGLEDKEPQEAVEFLSPIIHGHKENGQTAAVLFKVVFPKISIDSSEPEAVLEEPKPRSFSKLKNLGVILTAFLKSIKKIKTEPSLYIKDEQQKIKAKKTTLTVALILIGLLLVSIILGGRKKFSSKEGKIFQEIESQVNYRYDQALSLKELNPLRARLLLTEAKDLINQSLDKIESKQEKEKIQSLLQNVEKELESVAKEYRLEKADIFLDLSLAKEEFKGSNWGTAGEALYIFDKQKATVLKIEVDNKAYQVVGGGDKLALVKLIAATESRIFALNADKILVIDALKSEVMAETDKEDWGEIKDMVGFSGNLYLLDVSKNQIWKYRGLNTGLAKKDTYLEKENNDLSKAVSLAIDGSVWVLESSGEISKYTRGVIDNFNLSGLDKSFDQPIKIYTNEKLDNLYILDQKNLRIVVISKETGEYQAQYVWPGIAGAVDLAVFEDKKKILLLTGDKIYEIEIRE